MEFAQAGQEPLLKEQMTYSVEGRSIVVLMGKTYKEKEGV